MAEEYIDYGNKEERVLIELRRKFQAKRDKEERALIELRKKFQAEQKQSRISQAIESARRLAPFKRQATPTFLRRLVGTQRPYGNVPAWVNQRKDVVARSGMVGRPNKSYKYTIPGVGKVDVFTYRKYLRRLRAAERLGAVSPQSPQTTQQYAQPSQTPQLQSYPQARVPIPIDRERLIDMSHRFDMNNGADLMRNLPDASQEADYYEADLLWGGGSMKRRTANLNIF